MAPRLPLLVLLLVPAGAFSPGGRELKLRPRKVNHLGFEEAIKTLGGLSWAKIICGPNDIFSSAVRLFSFVGDIMAIFMCCALVLYSF